MRFGEVEEVDVVPHWDISILDDGRRYYVDHLSKRKLLLAFFVLSIQRSRLRLNSVVGRDS